MAAPSTERRIIEMLLQGRARRPVWLDVDAGDDAAVTLERGGAKRVTTVDTLVEGVHFDHRLSPADVGFKAIAVSVSDVASMGATPEWVLLALSLPTATPTLTWVRPFAEGLHAACETFGVYLIGGDVTRVPAGGPRFISVTAAGRATHPVLKRSGARPGDVLWTTGTPGLAGAGWMFDPAPEASLRALRRPRPPVAFALALAEHGLATAAMDLSDGPAADIPRLARASGVRIVLDSDALPVPPALIDHPRVREAQLSGGEDYALMFTASPSEERHIRDLAHTHQVQVTPIGHVTAGSGAALTKGPWPTEAFEHFGAEA